MAMGRQRPPGDREGLTDRPSNAAQPQLRESRPHESRPDRPCRIQL